MRRLRRREAVGLAGAALLAPPAFATEPAEPVLLRAIPSTGEKLPAVGLGTARVFDNDDAETDRAALAVIQTLVRAGGRLIDTASTYGDAESVIGKAVAEAKLRAKLFIATKLEEPNESELRRSLTRLQTATIDVLQLHNVSDPKQSLAAFRAWKEQGICRYIGVTSTFHGDFPAVESVLARERPDFVQIDYSITDRAAEQRILPLAAEVKAAVLVALPLGRGRLLRKVRGKALPDWAKPFAASWAQFFLKWVLADERVTAVIPGTANAAHMADNLGALRGRLPDAAERARMVQFVESL